jgi:hypothetical protein
MNQLQIENDLIIDDEDCDEQIYINTPKIKKFKWQSQLEALSPSNSLTAKSFTVQNSRSGCKFSNEFDFQNIMTQTHTTTDFKFTIDDSNKTTFLNKEEPETTNEIIDGLIITCDDAEHIKNEVVGVAPVVPNPAFFNCKICSKKSEKLRKLIVKKISKRNLIISVYFEKWNKDILRVLAHNYKEKYVDCLKRNIRIHPELEIANQFQIQVENSQSGLENKIGPTFLDNIKEIQQTIQFGIDASDKMENFSVEKQSFTLS